MNKFHVQTAIGAFVAALVLAAFIFLAAVASTAFTLPAAAQTPNAATKQNQCVPIDRFIESFNALPADIRNQLHIRLLDGQAAQRWITAFNALPPESHFSIDRVAFVSREGFEAVAIATEKDGCIAGTLQIPMKVHLMLLRDSDNEQGNPV